MTKPLKSMQALWNDSYLNGDNDAYIEALYETYLETPDAVSPEWQTYFKEARDHKLLLRKVRYHTRKSFMSKLVNTFFRTPIHA